LAEATKYFLHGIAFIDVSARMKFRLKLMTPVMFRIFFVLN
jgi:hypothetical protein